MRYKLILGYSVVGLLAVVLGQEPASAQAPPEAEGPAAETAPLTRRADIPVGEQAAEAERYLAAMEGVRANVRRDLEMARKERDVVKTLCLDDKLNQIDVALREAGKRKRALDLAAKRGDSDLGTHEFTILSVLHERVQQLQAEANQCIGKEVSFIGESSVSMEVEDGMPPEDPSDYPGAQIIVEPPNCASCFR